MPLRALLRYLMNNEQLIQKLADSYAIRRAAQLTASLYHKGKEIGEDKLEQLRESEAMQRLQNEAQHSASKVKDTAGRSVQRTNNIMQAFLRNLDEEWKKGKQQVEEEKGKDGTERRRRRRRENE